MRRTQLYLDDDLWRALHNRAMQEGTTISELVRQAARKQYVGDLEERRKAMLAFVGAGRDRDDLNDSEAYIRNLREDNRLERLRKVDRTR